jgi:hypothetical protein
MAHPQCLKFPFIRKLASALVQLVLSVSIAEKVQKHFAFRVAACKWYE